MRPVFRWLNFRMKMDTGICKTYVNETCINNLPLPVRQRHSYLSRNSIHGTLLSSHRVVHSRKLFVTQKKEVDRETERKKMSTRKRETWRMYSEYLGYRAFSLLIIENKLMGYRLFRFRSGDSRD